MEQGTIRSVRADRGFGFIRPDGETRDVFFHANQVVGATFEELREGQRVEFVRVPDRRDPSREQAQAVRPLD